MSDTERRYAQIEKEALASIWACEKFATYVLGTKSTLETEHQTLGQPTPTDIVLSTVTLPI